MSVVTALDADRSALGLIYQFVQPLAQEILRRWNTR
jgi:hypothetical protein